jgi:mannose-P-dolichol utilization defect protein 1
LVSKLLGFAIIAGSLTIKVPQILKIVNSGSAAGVANSMFMLELVGYLVVLLVPILKGYSAIQFFLIINYDRYVITMLYSYTRGFAFNTYGETVFIGIQSILLFTPNVEILILSGWLMIIDVVVIFLVAVYNKQSIALVFAFFASLVGLAFAVLTGRVSNETLLLLFSSNIVIFASSRVPQIWESFRVQNLLMEKTKGNLSDILTLTIFTAFVPPLITVFAVDKIVR